MWEAENGVKALPRLEPMTALSGKNGRRPLQLARVTLAALLVAVAPQPALSGPSAPSAEPSSSLPKPPPDGELPALASLPPVKRLEAEQESTRELDKLLTRLTSEKSDIREAAFADLDKVDASLLPAVYGRIQTIRESLDRDQAPRTIAAARKSARDARKAEKKSKKASASEEEESDWLRFMLDEPRPKDETWREVAELLAITRMLRVMGTTAAVRELLELRANFGEMLRVDLMRQVLALKDKSVPALLEAKKHDASVVREFADKALDTLGKVTPGEAVSTTDPEVLADTLKAFGYVREVEAVDVLLSFANHDRRKVRDAARQAIAAIGEAGRFRLRDAYQDLTGEKIDKSIPWDTLAKRMFWLYDNARAAEVVRTFETGTTLAKANDYAGAVAAYDKVLAVDPQFDRRAEMSPAYFELGKSTSFEQPEERLARLRKARRLLGQQSAPTIDAEIAFTEAKMLLAEGRPDRFLLKRAVELDPNHGEAAALLASFDQEASREAVAVQPKPPYVLAGSIATAAALLAALIALLPWRRKTIAAQAAGGAPGKAPQPTNTEPTTP